MRNEYLISLQYTAHLMSSIHTMHISRAARHKPLEHDKSCLAGLAEYIYSLLVTYKSRHCDVMQNAICMQDALMATIWVGVIVWVVRLAAVYCGSWIGAWLGGTPPDLRRKVWQGMITQVRSPTHQIVCNVAVRIECRSQGQGFNLASVCTGWCGDGPG